MKSTPKQKLRLREGDSDKQRFVTEHPKDWAFRRPSEGRSGKSVRAKVIKLKHVLMDVMSVYCFLHKALAGLPEQKWMVTCLNPARPMSAVDILRVLYCHDDEIEIQYNEEHKVLHFVNLKHLLT